MMYQTTDAGSSDNNKGYAYACHTKLQKTKEKETFLKESRGVSLLLEETG